MKNYLNYAKNIFSQNGEDGILEELFKDLNITNGTVVEFGAWDGVYLSNTFNLLKNKTNYKGILIEGDKHKYNDLVEISKIYPNIVPVHCFVEWQKESKNCLDNILKNYLKQDERVNLISIDIDSLDYYIAESIEVFLPDIFIIETNSSYDINTENKGPEGCSLKSLDILMKSKNYNLVAYTGNGIYVKNELINESLDINECFIQNEKIEDLQKINNLGIKTNSLYYLTLEYLESVFNVKEKK